MITRIDPRVTNHAKSSKDLIRMSRQVQERNPQGLTGTGRESLPPSKVAERVTVNLSRKSAEALDEAAELLDVSKTEVINKALQLFALVQKAQHENGGIWIKENADAKTVQARFF